MQIIFSCGPSPPPLRKVSHVFHKNPFRVLFLSPFQPTLFFFPSNLSPSSHLPSELPSPGMTLFVFFSFQDLSSNFLLPPPAVPPPLCKFLPPSTFVPPGLQKVTLPRAGFFSRQFLPHFVCSPPFLSNPPPLSFPQTSTLPFLF